MSRFVYRVHALQRMFEREIERSVVESVIQSGTTIERYPEDTPYPSRLVLGWDRDRPIHVVVADNLHDEELRRDVMKFAHVDFNARFSSLISGMVHFSDHAVVEITLSTVGANLGRHSAKDDEGFASLQGDRGLPSLRGSTLANHTGHGCLLEKLASRRIGSG